MRSLYVNSTLHEKDKAAKSVEQVLAIAKAAKELFSTNIIVTNPTPIRWGGAENKNDEQLKVQGDALNELGGKLRAMGLTLAYHNHDAEMRQSAREFHHSRRVQEQPRSVPHRPWSGRHQATPDPVLSRETPGRKGCPDCLDQE